MRIRLGPRDTLGTLRHGKRFEAENDLLQVLVPLETVQNEGAAGVGRVKGRELKRKEPINGKEPEEPEQTLGEWMKWTDSRLERTRMSHSEPRRYCTLRLSPKSWRMSTKLAENSYSMIKLQRQ